MVKTRQNSETLYCQPINVLQRKTKQLTQYIVKYIIYDNALTNKLTMSNTFLQHLLIYWKFFIDFV